VEAEKSGSGREGEGGWEENGDGEEWRQRKVEAAGRRGRLGGRK